MKSTIAVISAAACLSIAFSTISAPVDDAPDNSSNLIRLGLQGVHFIPNDGQWSDPAILFAFRSQNLNIAFRDSSLSMHLRRDISSTSRDREGAGSVDALTSCDNGGRREGASLPSSRSAGSPQPRVSDSIPASTQTFTLDISFPGSNPSSSPIGLNPQLTHFNYFIGDDQSKWRSNITSFASIIYPDLYPGIDLHITGSDIGLLKYEFHCAPGADSSRIRIHYDGIESLCVNADGNLAIDTSFGTLIDSRPLVWQESATSCLAAGLAPRGSISSSTSSPPRTTLPARFTPLDSHTYTITLDSPPDPNLPLVIDPDVVWMTYLGGSGPDYGEGIALDAAGDSFVTGYTSSADFEGRNNSNHGSRDAFIVKVSSSSVLQWMTYFGGSDSDYGGAIALDAAGNAFVTGETYSTDFAGRNNSYHGNDDAFVVKLSSSCVPQWMTYLGGYYNEYRGAIALDAAGNAFVTGDTNSTGFEGRNNSYHGGNSDAFIVMVSSSGALQWMNFLGGGDSDTGRAIALDAAGNAVVTGTTRSTDFEGRNNSNHGYYDAFVVKESSSGVLQGMTYLGGLDSDHGFAIALDGAGNAFVTGFTRSTDFEGRNNSNHGYYDAFVVKVSSSGALQGMTYLGGSRYDEPLGIALDGAGNAVVTGLTESTDFEGRNNSNHGRSDAFVVKVSSSGVPQWMTYLGGSESDFAFGIALDGAGDSFVTGYTYSTDFEGRNNSNHGSYDAFVLRLPSTERPRLSVDATCPSGGPIRISWEGATPRGRVALLFARRTGNVIIPSGIPCTGTSLGLGTGVRVIAEGTTGASGSATVLADASAAACGGYLQLLDISTCGTSNVAPIE